MPPQDPFNQDPDINQLLSMLTSIRGFNGMPGKTPAAQLNYYQDLVSTLGFDPVQQMGMGDQGAPVEQPFVEPINKQEFTYGKDPTYAKIFDLVKQGNSPAAAVTAAGIKDETQAKAAEKIAADYAGSLADSLNARQAYDAKTQTKRASYTAPDGSKYKNAPLGGPDINASASEYDLLGAPSEQDLMAQLASSRQFAPHAQFVNGGPQRRTADAAYTTPAVSAAAAQPMGRGLMPAHDAKLATTIRGTGPERGFDEPSLKTTGRTLYGDGTSSVDTAAYRAAVRSRMNTAKKTQVRSDASTNAVLRALALRTIIGG